MWDAFYDEIEGRRFSDREAYENWVKGWVEDSINEAGRVERWALGLTEPEDLDRELEVKIGGRNED